MLIVKFELDVVNFFKSGENLFVNEDKSLVIGDEEHIANMFGKILLTSGGGQCAIGRQIRKHWYCFLSTLTLRQAHLWSRLAPAIITKFTIVLVIVFSYWSFSCIAFVMHVCEL